RIGGASHFHIFLTQHIKIVGFCIGNSRPFKGDGGITYLTHLKAVRGASNTEIALTNVYKTAAANFNKSFSGDFIWNGPVIKMGIGGHSRYILPSTAIVY